MAIMSLFSSSNDESTQKEPGNTTKATEDPPKEDGSVSNASSSESESEHVTDETPEKKDTSAERTNIRQRLADSVKATPTKQNRSAELVPLTQEYESNRANVRALYAAAKEYQQALTEMHNKRVEMTKRMALISEDTPLYDAIGNLANDGAGTSPKSLHARSQASAVDWKRQSEQFDDVVLGYLSEWDHVTSQRISADIKKANKLKENRAHYEDKVDKLRKDSHKREDNGKDVKSSQAEKLERNEGKLNKAYDEHENFCGDLCTLIEQASTKEGRWRDLMPLAKDYVQWEADRSKVESGTFDGLEKVIDVMESDVEKAEE